MLEVRSQTAYDKIFSSSIPVGVSWREEALRYALDIRKFEIELYWKRATYFWTLLAASFAGYFTLQNTEAAKRNQSSIFIITCIGLVLSFAWYLVNRGSKYWQENWERHVDVLSEKVIGPLYRTTLYHKGSSVLKPYAGFPFSVSRVNQTVSLFVTLLWLGLAVQAFPLVKIFHFSRSTGYWCMAGFTLVFLILLLLFGWPKRRRTPRQIHFEISDFGEEPKEDIG